MRATIDRCSCGELGVVDVVYRSIPHPWKDAEEARWIQVGRASKIQNYTPWLRSKSVRQAQSFSYFVGRNATGAAVIDAISDAFINIVGGIYHSDAQFEHIDATLDVKRGIHQFFFEVLQQLAFVQVRTINRDAVFLRAD